MALCKECGSEFQYVFGEGATLCPACHEKANPSLAQWLENNTVKPRVTPALIGLCGLVFALMAIRGVSVMEPSVEHLLDWGASFGPYTLDQQWWRLLTSMFIHIGVLHLALNMWCLWSLGNLAERFFGSTWFSVIYLLSGIGGGIASLLWHPVVVSAGASGAIFGVAGAMLALFAFKRVPVDVSELKQQSSSLLTFLAYNLFYGFTKQGIDNSAHLGGLAIGFALGALISLRHAEGEKQPSLRPLVASLSVVLVLVAGAVAARRVQGGAVVLSHAEQLLASNQAAQAVEELKKVVADHPDMALAHYFLGDAYSKLNQGDNAIASYNKAVALEPDNPAFHNDLGVAFLSSDQSERAAREFQRAIELHPKFPPPYTNLGLAYVSLQRTDEAIAMFQKAIAADAKDSRAYFGLGQVYLSKESHALAISNYEKCLALEPDFLPARHSLGLAYASAGRTSDAIRTLEAILKDYPADATAQLLLDLARTKNGPARSPR